MLSDVIIMCLDLPNKTFSSTSSSEVNVNAVNAVENRAEVVLD